MGISPGDRGDRVRGNAAGRDRHPGRLAAFLGADHYSVFSNGPAVEREDRRGQHGAVRTAGRPDGAGAGPQPRTTGAVVTTADPVTAGAAAGSRGYRVALRVRPARPDRALPGGGRHQHRIQYRGCGAGADLCLAAVSGDFPRGCSPHRRSRLRGGGGDTWGAARHCLVARDPAVAAPGRGVRISTGVCPLARRVWRDPNLCRFPARGHPYPSAGDLPAAGDRSGRGGGIVTAARCGSGTGGAGCGCSYADRDRYQGSRS